MLRHFKRRQQELENMNQQTSSNGAEGFMPKTNNENNINMTSFGMPLTATDNQAIDMKRRQQKQQQQQQETKQQKRVRGRRSSKPAMEKRRRARINECLDILKSYVLNDSGNLNRLGIDLNASENQDEESIARQILKSSGLINRHRGRKNPNKLEKADILELTVDYVRRLHEQRDELLSSGNCLANHQQIPMATNLVVHNHNQNFNHLQQTNNSFNYGQQAVPAHLNEPLTLDLSPKSRQNSSTPPTLQAYRPPPNTPLTPPSSASSLQGLSDALEPKFQHQNQLSQMQLLSQVLDGHYKLYPNWVSLSQNNDQ